MKGPTIKLGEEAAHFEDAYNALLHAVVLESDARLKLATPVDTGRMRNAWTIGQNKPASYGDVPSRQQKELPESPDKQRPRLIADSKTQAVFINRTPQRYEGYGRGKERVGNSYVITNNMEYAEPIGFGTELPESWRKAGTKGSDQMAPDWVTPISKTMENWAKREWERMGNSGRF